MSNTKIPVALTDEKGKFDELVEDKGVMILIDPKALMHVIGTKMDFVDDKLSFCYLSHPSTLTTMLACD
ncbi:Iron-sulfur assembly protein IscA-like 1, mitochondrial [Glycine soja]|nr:Iron-sulfur assembly protein IscA-like 1, mitochondrial [Glycine soja]